MIGILHIKQPAYPQFRFEWHPEKRIVYLVRTTVVPEVGDAIALHINDAGQAHNAVNVFLRGYREGQAPGYLDLFERIDNAKPKRELDAEIAGLTKLRLEETKQ